MAFDATVGAATSNSYATAAEADAYFADRGGAAWAGLQADKEAALIRATAWIDGEYRSRWPGYRVSGRDQALEWPRATAKDAQGFDIDDASIPAEVKYATIEAALREFITPDSLTPDYVRTKQIKRQRVGPLSQEFVIGQGDVADLKPTLTTVEQLLSPIIGDRSGTQFLTRG